MQPAGGGIEQYNAAADQDTQPGRNAEDDVEHHPHRAHLRPHHSGTAQEGKAAGQHPRGPAVAPADQPADRADPLEPPDPRHQKFSDQDGGQAEPEQGDRHPDAARERMSSVAGGIAAADIGGGKGGEDHKGSVPSARGGEIAGLFYLFAAPQPDPDQYPQVQHHHTGVEPHPASPPYPTRSFFSCYVRNRQNMRETAQPNGLGTGRKGRDGAGLPCWYRQRWISRSKGGIHFSSCNKQIFTLYSIYWS